MRHGISLGHVGGIAVIVHSSFLSVPLFTLIAVAIGAFPFGPEWDLAKQVLAVLSVPLIVFNAALVHELAHAQAARARHIAVDSIHLTPFGGLLVPARRPGDARAALGIAFAGPAMNFWTGSIGGALALLIALLSPGEAAPQGLMLKLFKWHAVANLALCAVAVVPGLTLDGGRPLRALLWRWCNDLGDGSRWAMRLGWLTCAGILIVVLNFAADLLLYPAVQLLAGAWLIHNVAILCARSRAT